MRRSSNNLRSAALVVAALLAAGSAHAAGTSASDKETARELVTQARELQAAGKLPEALEKFKAAHALARTPVTGMELAKAHAALGHFVEARALAVEVATMPASATETEYSTKARREAVDLANALEPRIPSLRIVVQGVPADRTVTVTVDGEAIPAAAIGESRKLNPGTHDVVARVEDGPPSSVQVTLAEKDSREVTLVPIVPVEKPKPPPGAAPQGKGGVPAPAVVGMIVGGTGLLVGAITGSAAAVMTANLGCNAKQCEPSQWDDLDAAKAVATTSTIAFVVGGIAATFGLGYWLFSNASTPSRTGWIAPTISPTFAGVHGAF